MAEQTIIHSEEWYEKLITLRTANGGSPAEYEQIMAHVVSARPANTPLPKTLLQSGYSTQFQPPSFPAACRLRIVAIRQEDDRQ